jgi:bifunctional non-homologous end joining protein LigD
VLVSRNGNDISEGYPELAALWERVLAFNAVLDGEVVALGPDGRPSFGLLQQRMHLRGAERVARARKATPVTYMVFDVLAVDGQDLTRKATPVTYMVFDVLAVDGPHVTRSTAIDTHGTALFAAAREQGLEGIMAKRASSTYGAGRRSPDWRKIKVRRAAQVVVGGWLESSTGDGELGSLLVGAYEDGELRYMGRVGTGFDAARRRQLREVLGAADGSPFAEVAATPREAVHWVDPRVVVEVTYGEVTGEGRLRAPSYTDTVSEVDPRSVTRDALR